MIMETHSEISYIIQYVFSDWGIWFRFTVTMVLLKRFMLDMVISGTSTFWSWMTNAFKKGVGKRNKVD